MSTQQSRFIKDWQNFAERMNELGMGWKPAAMAPVMMQHEMHIVLEADVSQMLAGLSAGEGWLMLTDRVVALPANLSADAFPLNGEGCSDAGGHWRLLHDHADRWHLHRYQINDCEAEVATHLAEDLVQLGTANSPGRVSVRRLWRIESGGRPQPELTVFSAFVQGDS